MSTRTPARRPAKVTSFAQLKPKPPLTQARWTRLSRPQRCVALAKDAIAQIACGRFEPASGYLNLAHVYEPEKLKLKLPSTDKTAFHSFVTCDLKLTGKNSCTGCAKAALFLAHIRQNDGVSVDRTRLDGHGIARALAPDSFSRAQSNLIESYYEMWGLPGEFGQGSPGTWALVHKAALSSQQARRLLLILYNIIVNKGTFDPDQQPALTPTLTALARRLDARP